VSNTPKKKPQDRKPKGAADRLRAEAEKIPGLAETEGRRLTIEGRLGTVTVTTLNMLDWGAEVHAYLREGDYLSALAEMVSVEDARMLLACKPTVGAMMTAIQAPVEETGELSPGESQAS
jgi:hypothetical protein